jgi:hypothetical protein
MKRYIYLAILMGLALLLGSCWPTEPEYPRPEPWLCSINADGTGFRKIKKVDLNFGTTGFWDIYMTKDNRIIFYGEKLWISDTDTIRVEQITPSNLTLTHLPPRLSQSPDGSKLYFAADKNIYQLSYPDYQLTQLTNQSTRWLRNPIVSDLGNYITYSSNGFGCPTKETEYLFYMDLATCESFIVPTSDSVSANAMYIESNQTIYYEKLGQGLWKSRLDGTEQAIVDENNIGGNPNSLFSFSNDLRYVLRWNSYPNTSIRLFNLLNNSANDLPAYSLGVEMPLGRFSTSNNYLFYIPKSNPKTVMIHNLSTGEECSLFENTNPWAVSEIHNIAPTWDGTQLYFYADVVIK